MDAENCIADNLPPKKFDDGLCIDAAHFGRCGKGRGRMMMPSSYIKAGKHVRSSPYDEQQDSTRKKPNRKQWHFFEH